MWFVYLTYYLIAVVGLSEQVSAAAVLSGQLADGIMSPLVGILADMFNSPCGKKTPWYIFGTIFTIPTFLGMFIYPEFIFDARPDLRDAWYIVLPALFNVGWASA